MNASLEQPQDRRRLSPGKLFAAFRIGAGLFTIYYTLTLLPFIRLLYSNEGILQTPREVMQQGGTVFPQWMLTFDSANAVQAFFLAKIVAGVCLCLGVARRAAAVWIWFVTSWALQHTTDTGSPELPFVGWALLASALVPLGEPWSVHRPDPQWYFPPLLRKATWLVMGCAYTYSGYSKLGSPVWTSGDALAYFYKTSGTTQAWLLPYVEFIPSTLTFILTYATLLFEGGGVVWVLVPRFRFPGWLGMTLIHVGILTTMALAEVSIGMLLFHLFALDPEMIPLKIHAWLDKPAKANAGQAAAPKASVAGRETMAMLVSVAIVVCAGLWKANAMVAAGMVPHDEHVSRPDALTGSNSEDEDEQMNNPLGTAETSKKRRAPRFDPIPDSLNNSVGKSSPNKKSALRRGETSFTGEDLTAVNLRQSDLSGFTFDRAQLKVARLARAKLLRTTFRNADLRGATLTEANAEEADFTDADLRGIKASRARFHGARFAGTNLTAANLYAADLRDADLSGANLTNSILIAATLTGTIYNAKTRLPFEVSEAAARGMIFRGDSP